MSGAPPASDAKSGGRRRPALTPGTRHHATRDALVLIGEVGWQCLRAWRAHGSLPPRRLAILAADLAPDEVPRRYDLRAFAGSEARVQFGADVAVELVDAVARELLLCGAQLVLTQAVEQRTPVTALYRPRPKDKRGA